MNYLVDTNVISELRKKNCDSNVKAFVERLPAELLYICVISLGEIQYGIKKLKNPDKKRELLIWLDEQLPDWFSGRIIPIDSDIALVWGTLRAENKETLPASDSLLAATALARHLTILTRNVKDFERISGVEFINPWEK
jgi:predicted nucleic acid-binding protein